MVNIVLKSCKGLLSSNKRNDRAFISSADVGLQNFSTNLHGLKAPEPRKASSREVGGQPNAIYELICISIRCMCLNLRLQFVVAVFVLRPKRDSLMNYWKKSNTIHTTKTYINLQTIYLNTKILQSSKTYKKIFPIPWIFFMPDFFLAKWPESIVSNVHPRTRSRQPGSRDHPSHPPFSRKPITDSHGFTNPYICLHENP